MLRGTGTSTSAHRARTANRAINSDRVACRRECYACDEMSEPKQYVVSIRLIFRQRAVIVVGNEPATALALHVTGNHGFINAKHVRVPSTPVSLKPCLFFPVVLHTRCV
jgi:hypothetical protein